MHRPDWKRTLAAVVCATTLLSCQPKAPPTTAPAAFLTVGPVVAVDLSDARGEAVEARVASARNETVGLGIKVTPPEAGRARKKLSVRVGPIRTADGATIDGKHVTAYQVVAMPAETNLAAYVRHTGMETTRAKLPGALVPLKAEKDGRVQLAQVRDGGRLDTVGDKESGIGEPVTLWFDIHVPAEVAAGEYFTTVELIEKGWGDKVVGSLPVRLEVDDFVLPDERHLLMVSRVEWESLYKHWPKEFEAITPRLLNRDEERHEGAINVMDGIARAAQRNRVQVVFGRLQPTVKWPAAAPPVIDWTDFDTVVGPWLTGEGFAGRVPYGYWPLPAVDGLDRYDRASRMEYWQAVATHFDQKDWLAQATVWLDAVPGANEERRWRDATAEAAAILRAHSRVRVTAPVPGNALDVVERPDEGRLDWSNAARLAVWGPGLVYAPRTKPWPRGVEGPRRFLSAAMGSPTPYVGVGATERDVRQWAWLAFVQRVGLVAWPEALPKSSSSGAAAGAGEQVWLYPGHWFGVDGPVETVQLKWARRAAQDYEYLWLAQQRGEVVSPEIVARLLSRPVEIRTGQAADPVYALAAGTADQAVWEGARRLVARAIQLSSAGGRSDERRAEELRLETLRWTVAQGRPTGLVRDVRWVPGFEPNAVDVRVGVDLYSAAEDPAERNTIEWTRVPAGWQARPRPVEVPPLVTNQVRRVELEGRLDLDQAGAGVAADGAGEGRVEFVSGYNRARSAARFVLPIARSERREGRVLLDGELSEWNDLDAAQRGPLVPMLNRPSVRADEVERAGTPSAVYTAWGEDSFYVAFKLAGVGAAAGTAGGGRNFVEYQERRAWGEDLCEVLMQGVYEGGATGPVVHVVCKPSGGTWAERKSVGDTEWSGMAGAGVLYAGRVGDGGRENSEGTWRGEVAVPWKLLEDAKHGRPRLVRFNFVQHKASTGESASWAGPVDYGRDERLMGLIVLRESGR
jgi:hypothetical protein